MQRDEMIALRANLLRGIPHYEKDTMGNFRREKGGTPGLHELVKAGDFTPLAPVIRMVLDVHIKVLNHLLEQEMEREDSEQQEDEGRG